MALTASGAMGAVHNICYVHRAGWRQVCLLTMSQLHPRNAVITEHMFLGTHIYARHAGMMSVSISQLCQNRHPEAGKHLADDTADVYVSGRDMDIATPAVPFSVPPPGKTAQSVYQHNWWILDADISNVTHTIGKNRICPILHILHILVQCTSPHLHAMFQTSAAPLITCRADLESLIGVLQVLCLSFILF